MPPKPRPSAAPCCVLGYTEDEGASLSQLEGDGEEEGDWHCLPATDLLSELQCKLWALALNVAEQITIGAITYLLTTSLLLNRAATGTGKGEVWLQFMVPLEQGERK